MLFREHRGSLEDSMTTVIELKDRKDLIAHCDRIFPDCRPIQSDHLQFTACGSDERIGWNETYIVTLRGWGVLGFTNSAC